MGTFSLTRETTVDAAPERVRELLVDFRNWRLWAPWEQLDPAMTRTYTGPRAGVGARYQWSALPKPGEGEMEIVDVRPSRVVVALTFHVPVRAENVITFELFPAARAAGAVRAEGTEDTEGATRVAWTMSGSRSAVMQLAGRLFVDNALAKELDRGLATLKVSAESGGVGARE